MQQRSRVWRLGGLAEGLGAAVLGVVGFGALVACGSESDSSPEDAARAEDFLPAVTCDAEAADLYAARTAKDWIGKRGRILRCVKDPSVSADEIDARLESFRFEPDARYSGAPARGGASVYRVLYETTRGDGRKSGAVATIYVPDKPRRQQVPLVLVARGSRGQAPLCAPSRTTPGEAETTDAKDGRYVQPGYEALVWPLVGAGFAVVASDLAGYTDSEEPLSAYADLEDNSRSLIDSAHALREFLPRGTTTDTLLVGHSQGGHTALGALASSNEYALPGKVLGVATFAPLWFAQRAWGSVLAPVAASIGGVTLNNSAGIPVSIWYHYTKSELYDGPGSGPLLFRPEVRGVVQEFVQTTCWSTRYAALAEDGRSVAADFFDPKFVAAIGSSALARSCAESSDPEVCEKWLARYRADHPALTEQAGQVPLLVAYGEQDTTISPERFQCAVDKLAQGRNEVEYCVDPKVGHSGIVLSQSQHVTEWLTARAFGERVSSQCPSADPPADLECDPLLPND
jgi:pimeloyl-ACP methyl ester carboxylesterase